MKFLKKMIQKEMDNLPVLRTLLKSVGTIIESVHTLFDRVEETNKKIFKLEEDFNKIMDILTTPMPHPHDDLDFFDEDTSTKSQTEESEEEKKKRLN